MMEDNESESLSDMVKRQLRIPADPETLKFAVGLFQEAASGRMHGAHIKRPNEPGMHLTNVPLNRGMLAIVKETQHLTDDDRQALMMRVMHFGETISAAAGDSRFEKHVQSTPDGFKVSDEFMEAFATCRFQVTNDHICADMDSLADLVAGREPT
jgi:hypothetical protein